MKPKDGGQAIEAGNPSGIAYWPEDR